MKSRLLTVKIAPPQSDRNVFSTNRDFSRVTKPKSRLLTGVTYENFLQQVNLAEQLTSSDFGVSTGLISQGYWEQSKWYFVNVERGNISDKLQPRNINVSFNNNSNVPIDVIIFTFYSDQLVIDVETGILTQYFFIILLLEHNNIICF